MDKRDRIEKPVNATMEPDVDQEMGFVMPVGHETNVRSSCEDAGQRHRMPLASIGKDAERIATSQGGEKKANQRASTDQSESENELN